MLTNVPPPFRKREPRVKATKPTAPATPPTLVAAVYEDSDFVTLTFDRAVDVEGIDIATVFVDDEHFAGSLFQGAMPVTQASATTATVPLVSIGAATGAGTTLSVESGNGIVAVDGGAMWAGATGIVLPFG